MLRCQPVPPPNHSTTPDPPPPWWGKNQTMSSIRTTSHPLNTLKCSSLMVTRSWISFKLLRYLYLLCFLSSEPLWHQFLEIFSGRTQMMFYRTNILVIRRTPLQPHPVDHQRRRLFRMLENQERPGKTQTSTATDSGSAWIRFELNWVDWQSNVWVVVKLLAKGLTFAPYQ